MISIHALLTESDSWSALRCAATTGFQSTLSSRRATVLLINCIPLRQFQSTLSSRRATGLRPGKRVQTQHFNPRSPHGERHPICGYISIKKLISIHALLTESDYCRSSRRRGPHYFNPRSPHGERLKPARIPMRLVIFQSTLSSRRATFCGGCCASWISANFNPRSPHGERPFARGPKQDDRRFQSTLSSRRATVSAARPA